MPVPTFNGLPPFPTFDDVTTKINKLVQELRNLLLNLDTLNVSELNAEVITAGTITSDKIQAGAITTDKLDAGAVTADKINVNQLSAIAADMGVLTAGEVYGALIATKTAGNYPRIEFTSTGNLLDAQGNSSDSIRLSPDSSGTPRLIFTEGGGTYLGFQFMALGDLIIQTLLGTGIIISSGKDLNLFAGTGYYVKVEDWNNFYSTGDAQSLGTALNNLNSSISTLSSTVSSLASVVATKATSGASTGSGGGGVTLNGGIAIGTSLEVTGGGSVTWAGITLPSHSHTQI